jgi:glycosyltransferase involved in cell wall biosynthesis
MKPISFIQPSRNNLKYLKWSYNSIRKNLGYIHEICWADDFSDDGTWEWMNEMKEGRW